MCSENKCFLSRSSSSSIWFLHLVLGKYFFWMFYRLENDTVFILFIWCDPPVISYKYRSTYINESSYIWNLICYHILLNKFFLHSAFLIINDDMHPNKQSVQQSPYLWITLYFKGKWILKLKIAPGGRETIAVVGIQTLAYFNF